MFSHPISNEVRDALLVTAYLLLKTQSKKKKVKTSCCEGIIKTNLQQTAIYGMNGVLFEGRLETEKGDLKVSYMINPQDLPELEKAEERAWLVEDEEEDDEPPSPEWGPNPIRSLANN